MRLVRCTFTVNSVMPMSPAICLLRRPAVTWIMISRSRELSVLETLFERTQGLVTLPTGTIASEAGLDSIEEVLITEWLREELDGTALHRLHGHRDVAVRGDEDDRELPVRRGKLALKLKAASPRHSNVEHQAGRAVRRLGLQEIGNTRKLLRMQADGPQQPPDRVAKLRIVIDDRDTGIRVSASRSLR